MNNKNPYYVALFLYLIALCASSTACVLMIISHNLRLALFNLALVIFVSIMLGSTICEFNAYNSALKAHEQLKKELDKFGQFLKQNDDEPFKEFENVTENNSKREKQ